MNTRKKTVLLFQPSKFQAEIWRFVLWEHNIVVIWEENCTNKQHTANYFKTLELKPNLLIIDLKIDNAYEICRCFHQDHSSSKIILTTDTQDGYSSAIRRWAVNQGVDELLINFQKENLFSSIITNINSVLKLLDCPPAQQESLARALDYLGQKNFATPQGASQLQHPNPSISIQNLERTADKTMSPLVSMSFVLVPLLIVTLILDGSTLFLVSPMQGLQRTILAHSKKQTKSKNTNISTLGEVNNVPQGIFNYGGSTTWVPIQNIVNPKMTQEYPEFNLRYLSAIDATPGSGTGISMLLEGELDFSQSSRSIKQEEHILAHQQGFSLREYHVAIDAIAIAVHPSLQVSGLTIEQLKKIYLGQITNWKEVNGPDLKIVPFSRRDQHGGTAHFFRHHVLHDQPFSSNVKYVYSTTDALKQIRQTPGGIYYASAPGIVTQCTVQSLPIANKNGEFIPPYLPPALSPKNCPQERHQINIAAIENATYPLTRYLSVIVKQDQGRAQKAGEAYTQLLLTKEMQQLIKEAGFVPIH